MKLAERALLLGFFSIISIPLSWAGATLPGEDPLSARIMGIQEGSEIEVVDTDLKMRKLKVGDFLEKGDQFRTQLFQNVWFLFEDGTDLIATGNVDLSIEPEHLDGSLSPIREIDLKLGEVWFFVSPSATGQKYKLVVNTRNAAVVVKGTEFIVSADSENTTVYALSGDVEVAPEKRLLRDSTAQKLLPGEKIQMSPFEDLSRQKEKREEEFFADLYARHRHLERMVEELREDRNSPQRLADFELNRNEYRERTRDRLEKRQELRNKRIQEYQDREKAREKFLKEKELFWRKEKARVIREKRRQEKFKKKREIERKREEERIRKLEESQMGVKEEKPSSE